MVKITQMKKTTLRQAALRLAIVALAVLAPLGLRAQQTAPYIEGFESMTSVNDLNTAGWEIVGYSDASFFLAVGTSASNVSAGSQSLNIDGWNAGSNSDYVVVGLPLITNMAVNEMQITFSYKTSGGQNIQIGYLTDATDGTTFTSIQQFSTSSSFTTKTVEFGAAPNNAARIAIKYTGYYRCYIDEVEVKALPSCKTPQNLAVANLTNQGVTFNWERNASGTENDWVLEYGTTSDFTGATTVNVTGTPTKAISGLTANTTYYARVKANCGSDGYSDPTAAISFKTLCDPTTLSSTDWTENFDSYTHTSNSTAVNNLPDCWSYINTTTYSSYKGYPYVYYSSSYSNSGNYNLRFYSYYSSYSNYDPQPQYAILPMMADLTGKQITLKARGYDASSTFKIGTMTDPSNPSTFVLIAEQALTDGYQEFTYYLSGTNKCVAIMIDAATSSRTTNSVYIDDIVINDAPSCLQPSGLVVSLTPGNGTVATLNWTENGTATNWELQYGTLSDFSDATTRKPKTNPTFNLKSLTPETPYYVRVRAKCSDTDLSDWSDPITFTPTNAYTITVNDGTTTNAYVPLYAYYDDDPQRSEFIIPASALSTINGNSLTSIKFYPNYDYTTTKNYIVYLKEVTEETFSGTTFYTESDATTVYSGGLTISATDGLTIHFSTTFDYNGGNLLVGLYLAEDASGYYNSSTCPFYGISASGASISQYGSNGVVQRNFLPKATFEYEVNAYPKPKNLAVTNLTANGATITWEAPNTNVQSYKYQYREQGGTWSALTSTTDLSAPLTSLTGNTTYEFQVQALYAGDNESAFASKSFTTPCGAFSVDPTAYTYGFEDAADMACWTLVNGVTYTGAWDNATMQSNFGYEPARTGDNVFMFYYVDYDDTDPEYQTLISPELTDIPSTGLHVEFYYVGDMGGGGQETFRVGYSTTDNNLSSFTWGNEITNASTAYQRFSANYPAGTKYVAIQHTSDDQYYFFIDDITFEGAAACLEPTAVAANNITTTGAEITWTNGGEETAWDIFVTNDNTVVPDDLTTPTVAGTSTKPYPLTGLTHSTTYYVYVRSACSSTEHSAWSTPLTFHTECEGMDLPYSYGFEDGALSVCWNVINTNTSYNSVSVSDNSSNANTGTYSLNFFRGSYDGDLVAVLPEVGAYNLSDYQFEFSARGAYDGYEITVGIMTDPNDLTTFVAQGSVITTTTSYDEYKVRFNEYTGSGKYVAIQVVRPNSVSYGYVYVDDIAINPIPSCIEPDGLTVSNEAPHGATFGWTENANATAWQLYISENSTAPADDIVSGTAGLYDANTTPTFTLTTGLNPETLHYVWVRANCGTDGYSMWVGPTTFTTGIACPAPTGLTASNITGHTADLTWTGTSANYNIDYRTAAYIIGVSEEFGTSNIPTGWTRSNTQLTDDVLNGTTAIASYSGGWNFGTGNGVFDSHARMNVYGTSKYWLITPATTLTSNAALSFDVALTNYNGTLGAPATNGTDDRFVVLLSADDGATWTILREWNNSGSTYVYNNIAATATGENVNIDLSAYNGQTVKVAFYGESTVSNADNNLHIDNVAIGEAVAAGAWHEVTSDAASKQLTGLNAETKYEVKVQGDCGTESLSQWTASTFFTTDVACMAPTTLVAGTPGPNEVELTWTKTGTETAWQICLNGNETSPVDVAESDVTITGTTVAYNLDGLTAETPYAVKVRANCEVSNPGDGQSAWSNEKSFTTAADCPVPVLNDGDITNVSGHTADVAWTGFTQNDSYKVWYRVKEHINGISEGFNGTSVPDGWTRYSGLVDDVIAGTATLSNNTSWSVVTAATNVFNSNHMKLNIYGSGVKHWLVTPEINLAANSGLSFDLALTAYASGGAGTSPVSGTCDDDRFAVLIYANDAWTILREWNNSGSTYVYNNIATAGENVNIDLSSYSGNVKIAFYGESTTSGNGDNDMHIDNVTIGVNVAAGTWHTEDVAAPATSTTLTGLDPETPYEVYVTGHCATGNVTTDASATQTFTTTVACPAPVLADVDPATITTTTATLTWTGSAASNFTVAYKAANETDFTEVAATSSPFTFAANTLTPATVYTVKVKAVCGGSDGESEWSNTKTFTTDCDVITTLPWNVDFEGFTANTVPTCWDNSASTTSTISGSNPHYVWGVYEYSSNKMIRMYNYMVQSGTALINTPSIEMPTSGVYALTFDYAHNANCGDFIVKVSTDNGATFTNLASYSKGSGSSYSAPGTFITAEPISLASYAGQTIILQFFANANYDDGAIFVDNIKIEEYHVDKDIEANKWYAISSPVHNSVDGQTLAGVTNLTTGTYDLFGYTESAGTWNAPTVLEQGKGYIYRAAADATLNFVGTPNSGTVNANVTASCADNDLKGFNLVGNPYPHTYSYSGDYYSLNTNGTWQATTGGTIGVAEGFLVKVSASGTVDFTESSAKGNTNSTPAIALMVSNEEFEDVAYARLDNGEGLPKIGHLNSEAPMLSIPVDGRRHAIADLGSSCESFDLNFRGYGEYTISLKDNGQMGYIHLIDRATGRDIDLLSQPTYTFTATGNDANRFMVKLTPDAAESAIGSFAYWNGNAWVVEGEGTLQLFDALGRRMMTKEVSSQITIPASQFPAAGVYILRLGEKSQKIVVK